jgi:cell division protein FtsI/penicillin-binding protein 2
VLLAGSLHVKTVKADPTMVGGHQGRLARILAPHLSRKEEDLVALLTPRTIRRSENLEVPIRGVILARRVKQETWAKIQAELQKLAPDDFDPPLTKMELKSLVGAITTEPVDEQFRYYPGGSMAAHVLGFTHTADAERGDRVAGELVGAEGIERSMDAVLRGVQGWRDFERVRRMGESILESRSGIEARGGLNVVLTIDVAIQAMVEQQLADAWEKHRPTSISCIVMNPQTGEILALANLPTFDPNQPGKCQPAQRRNRAITDLYEPGSTFKVVTIGGALEAGVVSLTDRFDCENGSFRYRGARLGDVHGYDVLSVESILVKSSNIGAAKVGIRMGERLLYDTVRRFGMGERTGIPLPGERTGVVHPTNAWSKISVAWIPMGHEVATTPIQMMMAMCAVANGGRLMRPVLVARVEDETGRIVRSVPPLVRRQVIRPATAKMLCAALAEAVQSGTGRRAQMEQYAVAGKTGTAQKIINGVYVHDHHYCSFIGFVPAEDARLAIGVFMDDPRVGGYGGETAAPVFQAIAREAAARLAIPPLEVEDAVNPSTLAQRRPDGSAGLQPPRL